MRITLNYFAFDKMLSGQACLETRGDFSGSCLYDSTQQVSTLLGTCKTRLHRHEKTKFKSDCQRSKHAVKDVKCQ